MSTPQMVAEISTLSISHTIVSLQTLKCIWKQETREQI